jgi:hypothetical protein
VDESTVIAALAGAVSTMATGFVGALLSGRLRLGREVEERERRLAECDEIEKELRAELAGYNREGREINAAVAELTKQVADLARVVKGGRS